MPYRSKSTPSPRLLLRIGLLVLVLTALNLLLGCSSAASPDDSPVQRTTLPPVNDGASDQPPVTNTPISTPSSISNRPVESAQSTGTTPSTSDQPMESAQPMATLPPTETPTPHAQPLPTPIPVPTSTPPASLASHQEGSPLHRAAFDGTPAEVQKLLDEGPHFGGDSVTVIIEDRAIRFTGSPMILAAGFNPDPAVTALLLEKGVSVHARGRISTPLGGIGSAETITPLYVAAQYNTNPDVCPTAGMGRTAQQS